MNYGKIAFDEEEIRLTDEAWQTSRAFPGSFVDVEEGESYLDEWKASGVDKEGNVYRIIWQFDQIKGQELLPEELPWEDEEYIYSIELTAYANEL